MADPNNVKSIFLEASEKPAAERAAFLSEAVGGDTALRARVEALLKAHDNPDSFLADAAAEFGATIDLSPAERPLAERPGTLIGPYKLLEQIGEGGMGVVYMADQQSPVRRRVALKIIKAGMDTRQVIARFEAERQALALMDHSNIARVLDAGATDTGRPYFVMELVRGVPITEYCDQHNLSIAKRLELFGQVCQAVQHAHQKGLIHRDIKPTNVLVSTQDDRPVAKVIDFGVAKAVQGPLTDRTLFTEFQHLVGTPAYMSPEQAGGSLDIDTRSDVYSLGVLLYELLAGSPPFDPKELRSKAFAEMQRIIREVEPPTPSTRLSGLSSSAEPGRLGSVQDPAEREGSTSLASIAAQRSVEPRKLAAMVRGELDWIVMKALEKDRTRRYETPGGLARDIERYLRDEPVLACPPSSVYRFRKFARRNKAALFAASAAVAVLLLLVTGLAISNRLIAAQRAQAEAQRQRAEENLLRARTAVRDIMFEAALGLGDWAQLPPALRAKFTEKTTAFYQSLLQDDSSDPSIQYETAVGYRSLAGLHLSSKDFSKAEEFVRRSIAILDRIATDDPRNVEYLHQLAYSHYMHGVALARANKTAEAEMPLRKSEQLYQALLVESPGVLGHLEEFINCENELIKALRRTSQVEEADEARRRALESLKQITPRPPQALADREQFIESYRNFALRLLKLEQLEEALSIINLAVQMAERFDDDFPNSPECEQVLGHCVRGRGLIYRNLKRYDEAVNELNHAAEIFQKLTSRFPADVEYRADLAECVKGLGILRRSTGEFDESAAMYREAVRLQPNDAVAHNGLGNTLREQGRFADAVEAYRGAVRSSPENTGYRINLANLLSELQKPAEAEAEFREILRLSPRDAFMYQELGRVLRRQQKLPEAEAAYRKAIELQPDNAVGWLKRAQIYIQQRKWKEANDELQKAASLTKEDDKPQRDTLVDNYLSLSWTAYEQGNIDVMEAATRAAITINPTHSKSHNILGVAMFSRGDVDEAVRLYRKAIELNPDNFGAHMNLGEVFSNQGKFDEAIADYRKATEINPKDAKALNNLGAALSHKGNIDEALDAFRKAIEVKPSFVNAYFNIADTFEAQGKFDEALAIMRKAVEHDSLNPTCHVYLGNVLFVRGEYDEAVAAFQKAIELQPDSVAGYARLGHTLQAQAKPVEADAAWSKAIELMSNDSNACNEWAWFLATGTQPKFRDPKRAVELAKKAVDLSPKEGNDWNTLGVAEYRAGEWQAAIDALGKSMELRKGGDASDWLFLSMAHWQLDHKDEARKRYDKAVEWIDKNQPKNEELLRFRAEAAELLGIHAAKPESPSVKPTEDAATVDNPKPITDSTSKN